MKVNLAEIFLEKSGIKDHFDKAYTTFMEKADANEPLPKIAQAVAPHLRPVVQQFTGRWGRTKLQAASVAVNWKLSHVSEEEIENFLEQARQKARHDASHHSKDVTEAVQKFLDGLDPERISQTIDVHKGAVTTDMIEDIIAVVKAVKTVLPPKLEGYLQDLVPDIDELEDIIRREADHLMKQDTTQQLDRVFSKAQEEASRDRSDLLKNSQNDVLKKLEELQPDQIKRIIDHVGEKMTRKKINNLLVHFFAFADEVLAAFEDGSKPLREYEFKHGAAYQEAIAECLGFVEEALDAEGILPEKIEAASIRQRLGNNGSGHGTRAPRPPRP